MLSGTFLQCSFLSIVIVIFLGHFCPRGKGLEVNPMWSTNPWNKARPQHQEFHPLLFSYFIQKDKTLLLIVIFFLTVVNLIGDSHTNEVYIFRLWGLIEMHWLNYSVPKSLLHEILQKYQKSIHMWKVGKFCFLTWYPKIQLAIFTFVWRLLPEESIFCCWSWILCIHVGFQ